MKNCSVSGSVASSTCIVDVSFENDTVDVEVTLGVKEILAVLNDILSDEDQLKDEDFHKLLDIACEIQSLAVLRDAEKVCKNCEEARGSCSSCKNFSKVCGDF